MQALGSESEFTNPAPYGQACTNCSRAKCKCMRRPSGGACERCVRRGRDCKSPAGSRLKQAGKKAHSRTRELEAKLDSLVSLLQSSTLPTTISSNTSSASNAESSATGRPQDAASDKTLNSSQSVASNTSLTAGTHACLPTTAAPAAPAAPAASAHQHASHCFPASMAPSDNPEDMSEPEAEECLRIFRASLNHFPFVYIPASMTAARMRQDRPVLWLCILGMATKSASRQKALGAKIRSVFAEKLIVQHERSLDVLLGLLAYMGWANCHLGPHNLFLTIFSHLISGVVQDLGLDRAPRRPDEYHPLSCLRGQGYMLRFPTNVARTMEMRRAVLAAYLITSEVSTFRACCFGRMVDALSWTPQMDEDVKVLEAAQEAPLDDILIAMARLKLIANEARMQQYPHLQPSEQLRVLQTFQVKALQSQTEELKRLLPASIQNNDLVQLNLLDTELGIYSIGLSQAPSESLGSDGWRLAMLSGCLGTARSWVDIFLRIEPAHYVFFSFFIWSQLSHVLTCLYRLTVLEEPGWDRAVVREAIDLAQLIDEIASRFNRVPAEAGLINDLLDGTDIMRNAAISIRSIRAAWEPKIAPERAGTAAPTTENIDASMMDPSWSPGFLNNLGWMSDMFMSWEPIITGDREEDVRN
ncbi:hypothetical protein MFIFM68171_01648 [Madurella fahalii]|uniref:Zn(2)-C6 fungal-type domain-containing protein n=1 Tax=Madurella fahalii TaxID=1157608 RepID=A0ABQ0G102_9PEZI